MRTFSQGTTTKRHPSRTAPAPPGRASAQAAAIRIHSTPRHGLQAQLKMNLPGDSFEREADAIAEQVTRVPQALMRRACACGGACPRCQSQQRQQPVQTSRANPGGGAAAPAGHRVSDVLASSGSPLEAPARAFMESRFGHDFGAVRVHADARAARSAESIAAEAYTVGSDVVFAGGRYAPASGAGERLLAHELAHVVQQRGSATPMLARKSSLSEKWDALWGAGPIDSYRASKLADEALAAARQTGLPGLHNGPADAWRHCYWNCRMVKVIGAEDAQDIADNHEEHGGNSTAERMMDEWNNDEGRHCSGDCDSCCQAKLDAGDLWILSGGLVGASKPTPRSGTPSGAKY